MKTSFLLLKVSSASAAQPPAEFELPPLQASCAGAEAPRRLLPEIPHRDGSRDACGARELPLCCLLASCLAGACLAGLWAGWQALARPFGMLAIALAMEAEAEALFMSAQLLAELWQALEGIGCAGAPTRPCAGSKAAHGALA